MINNPFRNNKEKIECNHCKYFIVKPYPEDYICPNCNRFSANIFEDINDIRNEHVAFVPSQIEHR